MAHTTMIEGDVTIPKILILGIVIVNSSQYRPQKYSESPYALKYQHFWLRLYSLI